MNLSRTLATNITRLRKEKGKSQEKLAEACGVSTQQISKIENARANVCLNTLQNICEGLNVNITELFLNDSENDVNTKP